MLVFSTGAAGQQKWQQRGRKGQTWSSDANKYFHGDGLMKIIEVSQDSGT
jgi:hypothetical protein